MLRALLEKYFDVEELKRAWKNYSTWAFLLVMGVPELLPQLAAIFPAAGGLSTARYVQIIAAAGLIGRYVKQKRDEASAKVAADDSDRAGA